MKKIFFLLAASLSFYGLSAQNNQQQDDGKVTMIKCEFNGISKPLSSLFEENQPVSTNFIEHDGGKESRDRERRMPQTFVETNEVDPVVQTEQGTFQAKTLINWAGQTDGSCPPDPTGACGTNYYVQSVNATPFKVFNKTSGALVGTVRNIGSLWSPALGDDGDPIVLYDKFADRWLISEMGWNAKLIYVAISTTNNPTGTYYTYSFTTPNSPDYPKFSIWQDGYYVTSNESSQGVYILQRSVMLTGGTPKAFYKTFSPSVGTGFFCPLAADADGQLPPAGTPCPVFSYEDNGWGGTHTDAINVYSFTVDWTPATPTATITSQHLVSAAFDASYSSSWDDISQYGSTQMLDGIGGVLTYRAPHRVWTGYNSVVICMGVKTGVGTQRSIRWYELRNTGGTWSIYQQSTYAPADGLNRWVGSIAMDDNGSIGLAYACAGTGTGGNIYPSLRYTGRRSNDPLSTMTFTETIAQAGTGAINSCNSNRFGDYSHTSLDPSDGITFWHTGEYGLNGGSGGYGTRIYTFQIPLYVGLDENQPQNTPGVTVYRTDFNLNVKANYLPSNNQMVVDLFDINGQKISGKTIVPNANAFETSFNVTGLAAGTYLVRVGEPNTNFQKVVKVVLQ